MLVLVVEDDADIATSVAEEVEAAGHTAIVARDGLAGLRTLDAVGSDCCLVLLDLLMPGLNGWDFLRALRERVVLAALPVVVMTAVGASKSGSATQLGVRRILVKPFALAELHHVITECCGD